MNIRGKEIRLKTVCLSFLQLTDLSHHRNETIISTRSTDILKLNKICLLFEKKTSFILKHEE